jgi:hypothetical protein
MPRDGTTHRQEMCESQTRRETHEWQRTSTVDREPSSWPPLARGEHHHSGVEIHPHLPLAAIVSRRPSSHIVVIRCREENGLRAKNEKTVPLPEKAA